MKKILIILTGDTLNADKTFMERLHTKVRLTEVRNVQDCDFILVFCPIISGFEIDVEAALQQIPVGKPAILVVMHHTFDPDYIVPQNHKHATREELTIVDCLFHETRGLLRCPCNAKALDLVHWEIGAESRLCPYCCIRCCYT